jgi:hypothetical protein
MSWATCMKFRRAAENVRLVGWANLAVTIVVSMVSMSDGMEVYALGGVWATGVMVVTHAVGWAIDRHAERVVGR